MYYVAEARHPNRDVDHFMNGIIKGNICHDNELSRLQK